MLDGRLHRDGGAAIAYDGFDVYALNGVRVPRWLAINGQSEIDPKRVTEIENAEVRREFVRKIGIDRIYHAMGGEVLDGHGTYELVALDLRDGRRRPYLKMLNPSIGVWHLEGVHPDCQTVQQAINYRRYGHLDVEVDWTPTILT
jgi:hypothetical protein